MAKPCSSSPVWPFIFFPVVALLLLLLVAFQSQLVPATKDHGLTTQPPLHPPPLHQNTESSQSDYGLYPANVSSSRISRLSVRVIEGNGSWRARLAYCGLSPNRHCVQYLRYWCFTCCIAWKHWGWQFEVALCHKSVVGLASEGDDNNALKKGTMEQLDMVSGHIRRCLCCIAQVWP